MAFPTDNCTPRFVDVSESCGCTLTRADIRAMTPQDFEDQGFKEVYMDDVIGNAKEARMTGVPESSLSDLLLSRMKQIKQRALDDNGSVISPYLLIPQRTIVNSNYFIIEDGEATPGAGTGSIPASAWNLLIINSESQFATNLPKLEGWFLPGRNITVMLKDQTSGVARTLQFRVISAVNADAGGVNKATVTVEPNYSPAGWAALSGAQKLVYQPDHGVVVNMANSVSDYESWCYQINAVNNLKLIAFWFQTIRETHCYNDEYLKALTAKLTSQFFKKFKQMPLVQQRRQQEMDAEKAFYNTVFFGQRITEQQTPETYQNLPQVRDPLNPSCVLEFKANTIGIYTQLNECGRVIDLQGAALDMDLVKSLLYQIKRTRENTGGKIRTIDAMTDRFTADRLLTVMIAYYRDKYGMETTKFYTPGQQIKLNDIVMWDYNVYQFPDEGVELAVFVEEYFDDALLAFPTIDKSRGRWLWILDWSDISIGLARTASVQRQTNIADNLYNCVIKINVTHYFHRSKTIAVMLGDPNRHAIIQNFSELCPLITATACTPQS